MSELMKKFLDPPVLISIVTSLIAAILAFANLKSDIRDINTLQTQDRLRLESVEKGQAELRNQRQSDREVLVEMRADLKYIKEAVGNKQG